MGLRVCGILHWSGGIDAAIDYLSGNAGPVARRNIAPGGRFSHRGRVCPGAILCPDPPIRDPAMLTLTDAQLIKSPSTKPQGVD